MSLPFSLEQIYDLFYVAVHETTENPYTIEQRQAWAPEECDAENAERWQQKLDDHAWFIANDGDFLIGYGTLTPEGVIDLLFVHPDYQRQGIGSALLDQMKVHALAKGLNLISAESSLMAKSLFEKNEFKIIKENQVEIRGQKLANFTMHCLL